MAALVTGLADRAGAADGFAARSTASVPHTTRPVIVIGLPGLRWRDISARTTPAIWRLAQSGSVGSLAVRAINAVTCPADAWLTLNSGARATVMPDTAGGGRCAAVPAVSTASDVGVRKPPTGAESVVPGP